MNHRFTYGCLVLAAFSGPGSSLSLSTAVEPVEPRIAWYGTLASGLAEAKRTQRPILLVSGAPQCLGVPGIW